MTLSDVQDRIKQQMLFEDIWIVILEPNKDVGPESNLLIFGGPHQEMIRQFDPPVTKGGYWDGWVNFWVRDGKIFAGSWSGYQFELDTKKRELINGLFTK